MIDIYRIFLSGFFGARCRYTPSCSAYSREAFKEFGIFRGLVLTLGRLGRCHPWGDSGYDPVPGPTIESRLRKGAG